MRHLISSYNKRSSEVLVKPPILTTATYTKKAEATSDEVVIRLASNDWVFYQVTAIASCTIDGFLISTDTIKFINANDNAWSNEDTSKYYKTYIGGHNYREHNQDPKESLGFIADSSIRPVVVNDTETVYYVDLLIATNISQPKDSAFVKKIILGAISTFSMGCESTSVRCSRCGNISEDADTDCNHVKYQLGEKFITQEGKESQVANIICDKSADGEPGYIEFYEISYVEDPAFRGAVTGYRYQPPSGTDLYFKIPTACLNRPDPIKNGIKFWIDKGTVVVVG